MADNTAATSVSVLCAYPVSSIYDFNHRFVYYVALAVILLAPRHRWITPAAFAFCTLYTVFSTLYVGALSIAPSRLGPSLDIFALNSLFLTNTYALAAAVFCRPDLIKGKRGWLQCIRAFVWLWVGFITATLAKSSFERFAQKAVVEVQCFAENAPSAPANIFAFGELACENPCVVPETSVAYVLQEQLAPMVWGSLDTATNSFSKMSIPSLTLTEYAVVILFAVALASTLWINFFTSPQITRNTIFASLTQGKNDSRVRVVLAKIAALTWYSWSYFALLLVALATPFVSYVQEQLLVRYPTVQNSCLVRQWVPWAIGVALFLVKVAVWRRRREAWSKEKACRIRRFNTALLRLQRGVELPLPLPEHHHAEKCTAAQGPASENPDSTVPSSPLPGLRSMKHRIEIAHTRKISGLVDTICELKEWWMDPAGKKEAESATADEEKALLKGHY
ncbi:uncharacterized protein PV09_06480 [Verruconis gallopava]|uniref:Uncharacterized protein n=1 Tax=Verruconis gallopava TaxID=253628 RepID=A0A0D1YNQ5_9PEZI|nr:uncharacterized protein PV09_06480 [Verruconis gallopava]KIW02337.1 hypothetical protein PV09_06480 [Verruconis gallopava]